VIWVEVTAAGSCARRGGHGCLELGVSMVGEGEAKRAVSGGSWRSRLAHLLLESTDAGLGDEIDGWSVLCTKTGENEIGARRKTSSARAVCCNGSGWELCGCNGEAQLDL